MRKKRESLFLSRKNTSKIFGISVEILNSIEHGDFFDLGVDKKIIIEYMKKIISDKSLSDVIALLNRCYSRKSFEKRIYPSVIVKRKCLRTFCRR